MTPAAAILVAFCAARGGELEHRLPDGARVDCLTETHAWEVETSRYWAESVGQAVYYALASGRRAGIVLVLDRPASCAHLRRLWVALAAVSVPVDVETVGGSCE